MRQGVPRCLCQEYLLRSVGCISAWRLLSMIVDRPVPMWVHGACGHGILECMVVGLGAKGVQGL